MEINNLAAPAHKEDRPAAVSLIVPVRDEEPTLGALIESIAAQTLVPDEVLFVDGGSTDGTVSLLQAASRRYACIRVIEAGSATPGRGRNVGIAAARNEWVALTDAGIRLEATWLERLVGEARLDPSLEVVYGNYEPAASSFFERCAALAYVAPKQPRPGGRLRGPSVASALLRRATWREAGGFPDLRAAEDLIFMERIQRRGSRIGWAPGATVWWQLAPSLKRTVQKFICYSRHNAWAGRQRDWHYGLARLYLAGLSFAALAALHSVYWLTAPALGALVRVAKNIWEKREDQGVLWVLNPIRFLGVATVLACIDFATFWGWLEALRRRPDCAPGRPDLALKGRG